MNATHQPATGTQPSMAYEGARRNGTLHGFGRLFYAAGNVAYVGYWKNGQKHGNGIAYAVDGTVLYGGGWKHGAKHGHGRLFYQELEGEGKLGKGGGGKEDLPPVLYVGGWAEGTFDGHGILYDRNGLALRSGVWRQGKLSKARPGVSMTL